MNNVARETQGNRLVFFCPGCMDHHSVDTARWRWNGSLERPTLDPSILLRTGHYVTTHKPGVDRCWCDYNRENPNNPVSFSCQICHSFVRDGRIQFLGDCTHSLAGQTVPLLPVEER